MLLHAVVYDNEITYANTAQHSNAFGRSSFYKAYKENNNGGKAKDQKNWEGERVENIPVTPIGCKGMKFYTFHKA